MKSIRSLLMLVLMAGAQLYGISVPRIGCTYGVDPDLEIARAYQLIPIITEEKNKIKHNTWLFERLISYTMSAEAYATELHDLEYRKNNGIKLHGEPVRQYEIDIVRDTWKVLACTKHALERELGLAESEYEVEPIGSEARSSFFLERLEQIKQIKVNVLQENMRRLQEIE